jgi:phage baseplate assembly protein W
MATYFSDIDLKFKQHPLTKDLVPLVDADAVKNAIKNIVLTNKKERRFNPSFGGNVRNYLFENLDFITTEAIKEDIIDLISEYEPRVTNVRVANVSDINKNMLSFVIRYNIKNNIEDYAVDVLIRKMR